MSAARKQTAPTSVELESHCRSCEKELANAESTLRVTTAAAALPHDDDQQRARELGAKHNAELRVEAARTKLDEHREALRVTKRLEDETAALALGKKVGLAMQKAIADALLLLFEERVVGEMRNFLAEVVQHRATLLAQARELQAIWHRLGTDFRIPGVEVQLGTGRGDIPPMVSVDLLTAIEAYIRTKLQPQVQERSLAKDDLGRAALLLLLPALGPEHREQHSGRTLHELVWRVTEAGGMSK